MTTRRRTTASIALVLAPLAVTAIMLNLPKRPVQAPAPTQTQVHKITEDDPRWNCHTMGNHVCGTPRCATPAPATVQAYQQVFRKMPAADGGYTFAIGRKVIWLWGDDLQAGTRTSLTVQDQGCFKTSGELLGYAPTEDKAKTWFWLVRGYATSDSIFTVVARQMYSTGSGPWDWRETGKNQNQTYRLNLDNTITLIRTSSLYNAATPPNPGFQPCPKTVPSVPGQFCYSAQVHRELRLADGETLMTTARNFNCWCHPRDDYRVIFWSR